MPKYVLHYFDHPGRADVIRMMFHVAGVEFEDRRIKREDWPELKKNDKVYPFGKMPVLEVDDTVICQSLAIGRFLANEFGLNGKTNLEKAKCDMFIDSLVELLSKSAAFYLEQDETKRAALRAEFFQTQLPAGLKVFEAKLIPKDGLFLGDSISTVDVQFVCSISQLMMMEPGALDNFPIAAAYLGRIKNVAAVRKFMEAKKK